MPSRGHDRPRFPRGSKSRVPGAGQTSMFPDIVPEKTAGPVKPLKQSKANVPAPPRRPSDGPVLDPRFRKNYRRIETTEKDEEGFVWIAPTPTINPPRPRTLEAGYNRHTQDLRVVFRDGTPWVYHAVEPQIWERFRRTASPGRFINRVLNYYPYERGDFDPPGLNARRA